MAKKLYCFCEYYCIYNKCLSLHVFWNCSAFVKDQKIMYVKKLATWILFVWGTILVIFYINVQNPTERQTSENSLFKNNATIRHCATGAIIGVRPSATTVLFQSRTHYNNTENSQKRKTSFQTIFEKKIWGRNRRVNFSGSGKIWFNIFVKKTTKNLFITRPKT